MGGKLGSIEFAGESEGAQGLQEEGQESLRTIADLVRIAMLGRLVDTKGYLAAVDGVGVAEDPLDQGHVEQLRLWIRELEMADPAQFEGRLLQVGELLDLGDTLGSAEQETQVRADLVAALRALSKQKDAVEKLIESSRRDWQLLRGVSVDDRGPLKNILDSAAEEAGSTSGDPIDALTRYHEVLRKTVAALNGQFFYNRPGIKHKPQDRVVNIVVELLSDAGLTERHIALALKQPLSMTVAKVRARLDYLVSKKLKG